MTTSAPDFAMSDASFPAPPLLEREVTGMVRTCTTCYASLSSVDDWKTQCEACFKDPLTKRDCTVCGRARIPLTDPEWKKVCAECFKDSAKRACTSCGDECIPSYEPAWRTLCKVCFSDSSKFRICVACKLPAIKPGTAKYLVKCTKCWLDEKQKRFIVCSGCGRLDCLRGQAQCKKCMVTGVIKKA